MKMMGYESSVSSDGYMCDTDNHNHSTRLIDIIDLEVRPMKVAKKKRGTFRSRKDKQLPTEQVNKIQSLEISSIDIREPVSSPENNIFQKAQSEANSPYKLPRESFLDRLLKRPSTQNSHKPKRQGAISESHSHSLPQLQLDSNQPTKACNLNTHAPIRRTKSATTCAHPDCKKHDGYIKCVKHCTTCFRVVYCSEWCKIEHWPTHKADCKELPTPYLI